MSRRKKWNAGKFQTEKTFPYSAVKNRLRCCIIFHSSSVSMTTVFLLHLLLSLFSFIFVLLANDLRQHQSDTQDQIYQQKHGGSDIREKKKEFDMFLEQIGKIRKIVFFELEMFTYRDLIVFFIRIDFSIYILYVCDFCVKVFK